MAYNPPIGSIYHLYTTYILPSRGLYNPYHLLPEPEKSIEVLNGATYFQSIIVGIHVSFRWCSATNTYSDNFRSMCTGESILEVHQSWVFCWVGRKTTIGAITPRKFREIAPENRPILKGKLQNSNHPFSGAFAVSFREGFLPALFQQCDILANIVEYHEKTLSNRCRYSKSLG